MFTWSTHQLTEFFTAVTASADENAATAVAVERAAEMVEAEAGAVVLDEEIHSAWGFGPEVPVKGLLATVQTPGTIPVPGVGDLYAVPSALGSHLRGALIVARLDDPFTPEERQMLQGMAQVLGLALRSIRVLRAERTLRAEREREAAERLVLLEQAQTRRLLVETLLTIQREISNRKPLPEILDAVTSGTAALLGGAPVALILAEAGRARRLSIASTSGAGGYDFADPEGSHTEAREAMATGAVIMQPADPEDPEWGTVIAAPVRVTGEMAGSLVAQLPGAADRYAEQRDQLAAFAQQVSLALTDARTVEAVREAHHDAVTGLPNRGLFLKIFNRVLASRAAATEPTSVLFIDLDRFKAVNDSLGHEAGDQLLAAVAGRIRGCVRASDTTARLGGDEFAVLLHNSPVEAATAVGERVISAIKEAFRISGRDIFIGASVGVAISREPTADSNGLLNKADVAMYRAKKDGPGKVVVYEPHMHTEALNYLSLRGDLQRALAENEFRLQYQPLVRLDSGDIAGVEALIRWHSPTRGLVSPADFIPIAEESGLIVDIGQWVLESSAAQVAAWRRNSPDLTLNVNVSGHQLVHPRFAANVTRALAVAGLPSSAVTLELTESVLMSDPDAAVASLASLRELGVQLSIDDFGTGYSSLAYLRELPVDELKIDRAFIARAELTSEDLALVRTIVELGHILGLRVVAEGIENAAQLEALRRLGCSYGQGYHLCRPSDPADLPKILAGGPVAPLA
ncbi:putative bifunctional diguanylate cyclase/phosphodiesterase [Actinoplanes friuliensis]|uniref:Putative diguanylate cyclase/phosphodiesterase with GAF sensor n=1 Tax=Actinoplanes friuliensis DSM 7358 TaxID=1246995 RepID=U5WCA5_9ACTN|nr:EAL domain-containing protein [Actinoplanes friuliensis]AGZ46597.1 putative diguanylate cyclase/phosphodiesterase with GAF sensor [Actinoplanes friuliensis DSM 7358]